VPSPTTHAERLAYNEVAYRTANERMLRWEERHGNDEPELYLCECSSLRCPERLPLSREEYEGVRANPKHFLVHPGHENAEVEAVVIRHEHYFVVEKDSEVSHIVRATDPRAA
jgi:hypothetical protein